MKSHRNPSELSIVILKFDSDGLIWLCQGAVFHMFCFAKRIALLCCWHLPCAGPIRIRAELTPFQILAMHASHLGAESLSDLLRAFLVNYRGFEIKEFVERLVGALTAHSSRRDYTYRREADFDQLGGASGSSSQRSWQICQIRMKQVILTVMFASVLLTPLSNKLGSLVSFQTTSFSHSRVQASSEVNLARLNFQPLTGPALGAFAQQVLRGFQEESGVHQVRLCIHGVAELSVLFDLFGVLFHVDVHFLND